MPASDALREAVLRKGYVQDPVKPSYFEQQAPYKCVRITDNKDGSFSIDYYSQYRGRSLRGEFGPKGGRKNYAARAIADLFFS